MYYFDMVWYMVRYSKVNMEINFGRLHPSDTIHLMCNTGMHTLKSFGYINLVVGEISKRLQLIVPNVYVETWQKYAVNCPRGLCTLNDQTLVNHTIKHITTQYVFINNMQVHGSEQHILVFA